MIRNALEPWHLLIVVLVVIVLFGSKKLPDTARALGKSMRILKSEAKAMKGDDGAPPTPTTTASRAGEGPAAPHVVKAAPGEARPTAAEDASTR
ncbi:Sec-independent protein translocase subunit TatA [Streptomyces sp. NPDC047108]|uniref:Sec-independent protein translocase subunit TatA n=1 Tax=Streptomyces sp. NPDC047108 TaxID=3155025 RepID=UPI0033EDF088